MVDWSDVNGLLVGILSGLLGANTTPSTNTNQSVELLKEGIAALKDPAQLEYLKILQEDDLAQAEVDRWIREAQAFEAQGAGVPRVGLVTRIEKRLEPVRKAYEDFIARYPKHTSARLAYGSFLNDIGEEQDAIIHWEKAREIDPSNPAAWNNLANYFGHRGPVVKAFSYYEKAIELNPKEPVYYQNFATTLFLFRTDAREHYKIDEQEIFTRSLQLYRKALELDPTNFLMATDLAQTYYGIKPPRTEEALEAWKAALQLAPNEASRQGTLLHLARVYISAGRFAEAKEHLNSVALPDLQEVKRRLLRNISEKEQPKEETGKL